jgi:hypothetical protein
MSVRRVADTGQDGEFSMNRGLVVGAVAFAVAYTLEGEWAKLQGDIKHYDWMRAMSGEKPLVREQIQRAVGLIGWLLSEQSPAVAGVTRGLGQSIREDIVRYAKLDTM